MLALFCGSMACSDDEKAAPLVLHTSAPFDITETTAALEGSISQLAGVSEVGICWSKDPEKEFTPVAATGVSETYQVTLTGLRSGTLYYARAYAKRGDEIAYGELRNFTAEGLQAVSLPFNERFRGDQFPPLNWNILDKDGDGYNWEQYDNRFFAALSDSYRSKKELTPENYLITPKLEITGANPTLKWSVGVLDADYYQEHYKVIVSETPFTLENADQIGTIVFEETLTADAYRSLLYRSVSLADYKDKDIYVAWVHYNCTGLYCMYVTDITVESDGQTQPSELALLVLANPENVSRTSADVQAEMPTDGGTTVIEKGFCYATHALPSVEDEKETVDPHKTLAATLSDLTPGTTYYVRAYARNQAGLTYSDAVSFTTPEIITTTLLSESLTSDIPASWTILDKDGDGYCWEYYDGYGTVCSDSYLSAEGALTPENYLITPSVSIPEEANAADLLFEIAASAKNAFRERYKVILSETPLTVDNCQSATNLIDYVELTEEYKQKNFIQQRIDLSEYVGKTIYIGFVHGDCSDMESILLKNVTINSYE